MVARAYQIEPSNAGSLVVQHTVSPLTNEVYLDMTYDGQMFYGLTSSEVHMWQLDSTSRLLNQVKKWKHGVSGAQGISTDGETIYIIGT